MPHQQVYDGDEDHQAKFSHELIGGAAAFEGMKLYEDKQRREGRHSRHPKSGLNSETDILQASKSNTVLPKNSSLASSAVKLTSSLRPRVWTSTTRSEHESMASEKASACTMTTMATCNSMIPTSVISPISDTTTELEHHTHQCLGRASKGH